LNWAGKPLPAPPSLSCKPLPDDPPGLLREGMGCDAKGGSGTAIIPVTNAASSGPGSLVAALDAISPTARRVVIDPAVAAAGKPIVFLAPYVVKRRNVTLDCNGATIAQRPFDPAPTANNNALGFGATDDIIVTNCHFVGTFKGSDPNWVPPQNNGNGFLDGDVNAIPCESWDTECQQMSAALRRSVVRAIFDRNTWSNIGDDALGIWGGGWYLSFTRNLVKDCFHPSTTGWKGLPLNDPALMRLWNSWLYNVATKNGERNLIYPREGTHWWLVDRNLITDWTWYQTRNYITKRPEWNFPQGVRVSGQAALEANMGVGRANCALGTKLGEPVKNANGAWVLVDPTEDTTKPFSKGLKFDPTKPNSHATWGEAFDNGGCDTAQACAPACDKWSGSQAATGPSSPKTVKFGPCHPRASQGTYFFAGNEGEGYEWFSQWPKGYQLPTMPYTPDLARPWSRVLDEVGAPNPPPDVVAEIARLRARISECKVPVPPQ